MGRDDAVVMLTESAASKVRAIMATTNAEGASVRVAALRTPCMGGRGFRYLVALDDDTSADDIVFEDNGLRVSIDRTSARYLEGATVDYEETLAGTGFTVDNPNAAGKCPCRHHDILE
jgi:iron-sulfur cluster assembly protein